MILIWLPILFSWNPLKFCQHEMIEEVQKMVSHTKNNDTFHIICQLLLLWSLSVPINTPILARLKKFVTVQINGISFWLQPPFTFRPE